MHRNDNKIRNYDKVLDKRFGKAGSAKRALSENKAYNFYAGVLLKNARMEAKMTQLQLALKTGTSKSYISRIENGDITPSAGVFYRFVNAMGMKVEIVRPISSAGCARQF